MLPAIKACMCIWWYFDIEIIVWDKTTYGINKYSQATQFLFGLFFYHNCVDLWQQKSMYVKTMYMNELHIFIKDNIQILFTLFVKILAEQNPQAGLNIVFMFI